MTKKGYQKRLPSALPPAATPPPPPPPRRAPGQAISMRPAAPVEPQPVVPQVDEYPLRQSGSPPLPTSEPAPALNQQDYSEDDGKDDSEAAGVGVGVGVAVVVLVISGLIGYFVWQDLRSPPVALGPEVGAVSLAPSALAAGESYVQTQVLPKGDLVVNQWILPERPLGQLSLALPEVPGAKDLSASRVLVLADGVVVAGPAEITDGRETYVFARTTDIEVRYVLGGAVERSASVPGRALALATSLEVRYAPLAERETRVVHAPVVLSLACTSSPTASPVPCGAVDSADDSAWRVQLTGPGVANRVMAQLTLG